MKQNNVSNTVYLLCHIKSSHIFGKFFVLNNLIDKNNFLNERVEDTVQELKDQKRDGQNTEQKISKLSKAVRDKEDEIESLIDQLAQ